MINLSPEQCSQITKENFVTLVGWLKLNKMDLEDKILTCDDGQLHETRAQLKLLTHIVNSIEDAPDVIRRVNEISENTDVSDL